MTLIDWSDPEAMLGRLVEYVQDEAGVAQNDRRRAAFLRQLSRELLDAAERPFQSAEETAAILRGIENEQPRELAGDPVMVHVAACIDELDRIASGTS